MMRKNAVFTTVAVATLALGIGANTAVFSVVNAVLLNPLPYKDPGRLVLVKRTDLQPYGEQFGNTSYRDFQEWKSQSTSFDAMTVFYKSGWSVMTLTGVPEPEKVQGAHVDENLFPILGVHPLIGRSIAIDDIRASRRVIVLSYALWQRRFGGSDGAIGMNLEIEGANWQVIGVMPPQFKFPYQSTQFWAPITAHPEWIDKTETDPLEKDRWTVAATLKPGVSLDRANAEMSLLASQLRKEHPDTHTDFGIEAVSLRDQIVGDVRRPLAILLCAVSFVLLIACVNVANMFLARGTARSPEFAVRTALGASKLRIVRQLLTEAVTLALLAGSVGVLIAIPTIRVLKRVAPRDVPRLADAGLDIPVLLFTLLICLLAVVVFGVIPAWRIIRRDPNDALKERGRAGMASRGSRLTSAWLGAAQFAIALVLLTSAGLLIRSFVAVMSTDPGFQPERTLTLRVNLPSGTKTSQITAFYVKALENLRMLPGVRSAGMASNLFYLNERRTHSFRAIDGRAPEPEGKWSHLVWSQIHGDYFQSMGIRLLAGRYFNDLDQPTSPPVAIVNETLARRFWPGENPVGKRIKGFDPRGQHDDWVTIVGLVRDTRSTGIENTPISQIYEVHAQRGDTTPNFVIRTAGDPVKLAAPVRSMIRSLSKTAIISDVVTIEDRLRDQTAQRRFQTWLLGVFSALALVLAGIGIYGVMQYSVSQRTHELGLRMALGARASNLFSMVLLEGLRVALGGMLIGAVAAFWVAQSISALLYGVHPTDPVTFASVAFVLLCVAAVACYIPALRATRVDPTVALRAE
jgi:putative ABC transport system permease protein